MDKGNVAVPDVGEAITDPAIADNNNTSTKEMDDNQQASKISPKLAADEQLDGAGANNGEVEDDDSDQVIPCYITTNFILYFYFGFFVFSFLHDISYLCF